MGAPYDLDPTALNYTYCGVGRGLCGAKHLHDPILQLIRETDGIADVAVRSLGDHSGDDAEKLFGEGAHLLHESLAEVVGSLRVVDAVCPAQKAKAL